MTGNETLDINAYLDGELGPEDAAEIEARLDDDPEARARCEAYAAQKANVGKALDRMTASRASDLRTVRLQKRLAAALHRRAVPARTSAIGPWLRSASQVAAACALVTFGWWGHGAFAPEGAGIPEYVSEAVGAHRVFAEDLVRPAEFTGTSVGVATEWFSSKIGKTVNAPDLSGFDMTLVGARLLGTKEGPLVQFIYEGGAGERYSLTLARHPADKPVSPLHVVDYPDSAVGYWSTPDIDFALVGKPEGASIQDLVNTLSQRI